MNAHFLRLGYALMGLLVWTGSASAATATLESLLAQPTAPPGVVFEIVDRDPNALQLALPWVQQASQKLKARFPKVPMALVTHGQEMFALQSSKRADAPAVHQLAESLSKDGIPVHVCETYAGWRGIGAENFPSYIDVAPAGPTQIRNYEALDYVRVVVPRAAVLNAHPKPRSP
ncbi:MAG: DsrE family protein [Thiobacillus sp.]|nr:DsrE family protein [Thiobacillus sp.]